MSKTDGLDPSVPAGAEDPKLGDNRIRELARAVAEILNVDHYIGSDGGAGTGYNEDAAGEHAKVTLRVGSAPTLAANKGFLYTKDVTNKVELFFMDEDGDEIQLTLGGVFNPAIACGITGNQTIAGIKTFSNQPVLNAGLTAAAALVSTLATGTAPLTIASTTVVPNLNADKVDGYDVAAYAGGESYTFPGGRIEKVGYKLFDGTEPDSVTFGAAFPNACIAVLPTQKHSAVRTYSPYISAISVSGFTVGYEAGSTGCYWLAIGY